MKLQTKVNIPSSDFKISPTQRGLVIGSCFAENIGKHLTANGFNTICNPQGILYNPLSILEGLQRIKFPQHTEQHQLILHNDLYHSMSHHGSFSDADPQTVLSRVNTPVSSDFDYIIVTLGSSFVYKMNGTVVANCHKLPKSNFTHTRLSFSEITHSLDEIINLYDGTHIIFTVSPIRHLSDTLTQNSASKALLRAAITETLDRHANCSYFPSFEIMIDELRDYRFYASDMLHPSIQAVEYIIEGFEESYFSTETQNYCKSLRGFHSLQRHRILHTATPAHQKHVAKIESLRNELISAYPFLSGVL